jgi:hypothetical protein
MRTVLALLLLSFGVAAHADSTKSAADHAIERAQSGLATTLSKEVLQGSTRPMDGSQLRGNSATLGKGSVQQSWVEEGGGRRGGLVRRETKIVTDEKGGTSLTVRQSKENDPESVASIGTIVKRPGWATIQIVDKTAGVLKTANEIQESYTPRVDKLETALRTHSHHALETLPNRVLAQLKAGQAFTLAKTDERVADESARSYSIVIGNERQEISLAAYQALRGELAYRQR